MIHSLSGGVIADNGLNSFAKVELPDGTKYWYLNEFPTLKVGDQVLVPLGRGKVTAKVVLIELNSVQTAPIPLNRIKSIEMIL